jgi:glucokinase
MTTSSGSPVRLVTDIGGTNSRFGLWDEQQREMRHIRSLRNAAFAQFTDALTAYLEEVPEPRPRRACLAVAAPASNDRVTMTNVDWSFCKTALRQEFGFDALRVINDFEAVALSLPHLQHNQLACLRTGERSAGHLAALGPGTGLGGSKLLRWEQSSLAVHCEPGEVTLGPGTPWERKLFQLLYRELDEIHNEDLLSGTGLQRLYRASAELLDETSADLSAAEISQKGKNTTAGACRAALSSFCALLGSAAADFVLSNGAYGGLYLAGGILPRLQPFLTDSDFMPRFTKRGPMTATLRGVPVYLIVEQHPGLLGAAVADLPA